MALTLGYGLSCEEHGPNDLVRNVRAAEEAGFEFAMISDHFHQRTGQARLYTLPAEPVEITVAAAQPNAAQLAGRLGNAFIGVSPGDELGREFDEARGGGKPRNGQLTVCHAESEAEAKRTALEIWPNGGMSGPIGQELAIPSHYETVAELVDEGQVAETVICGPDPDRHLEAMSEYEQAGYDHVWVHQVGRDQESFVHFYSEQILPSVQSARTAA